MNLEPILIVAVIVVILYAFANQGSSGHDRSSGPPTYPTRAHVLAAGQAQGYAIVRPASRFEPDLPIAEALAAAQAEQASGRAAAAHRYSIVPAKESGRAVVHVVDSPVPGASSKPRLLFELLTAEAAAKPAA